MPGTARRPRRRKAKLSQILIPFLMITGVCVLLPLVYGLYTSLKVGISVRELLKSQLQTFLIAFSTASSAAAFGTNVECCEEKLRIDGKFVRFGVPFGQVLFMPGVVALCVILPLYMAKQYAVPMTPTWIATMLIIVPILSAATPSIPGGELSSVLVLFSQLGIPTSCLAISATVIMFTDYAVTACNITCLQQELMINAKKLDLLKHQWK